MAVLELLLSVPLCLQWKRATEDCLGVRGHEHYSCQRITNDMTRRMWLQQCGLLRPLPGTAPSCDSNRACCCSSGPSGTSIVSDLHQPLTSAEERTRKCSRLRSYSSTEPRVHLLRRSQDAACKDPPPPISTNQKLLVSSRPERQKGASGWCTLSGRHGRSSLHVSSPLAPMNGCTNVTKCGAHPKMVFLAQVAGRLSQHLLEAMAGALVDLWLQLCCTFFDHLPVTHHRRRSSEIPEVIQLLPLLTVQILQILLGNELPNSAPLKILAQVIYWLYEYINCRGKRTTHKDGVPKFYRWITERYLCLSSAVKEYQIPEFDNLYLDMNGIIHVCSHTNDDDPHFRITEEKIFLDIFNYIDFLFRMIKPKKTFFMAVDGVAPRAKMNQQRGRRFKSAKEAQAQKKEGRDRGEVLPTEEMFDSNCISPGTELMARLQDQLQQFVATKVSTDPLWRGVKVYLSGHQTPGEGEHKVMDFIRTERSQPCYDPNTRHCLYGLDADLITLGMCSHEPHFALLDEEIVYGKRQNQKSMNVPEEITFHLLHLSLLREYLELEFQALKETIPFEFKMDNIIDDWVLMCFLVGNDFLLHLRNLHIAHNALPVLYQAYINVMPSLGGYINEYGKLNLERFEKFLTRLSQFDYEKFSDVQADQKFLASKRAYAEAPNGIVHQNGSPPSDKEKTKDPDEKPLLEKFSHLEIPDSDSDEEPEGILEMEFRQHKRDYYVSKLDYKDVNKEVMQEQAHGYVRAIQWNLHYYYNGVQSWNWYYPHHYSPYISDIKDFQNLDMTFELGKPFLPFQQLMAILPSASKKLVPSAYQDLHREESRWSALQ